MDKKTGNAVDLSQRLFIELGTSLRIETPEKTTAFSGKLIGMKVGAYLIVEVSGIESTAVLLAKGEQILVKYINQDDIFNFSSTILTILNQPGHLVFLHYPDRVESCNIRRHKRVECFLPIHVKARDCRNEGVITNISANGCFCSIDNSPSWENISSNEVELIFSYGNGGSLSIAGDIRSSQILGSQAKLGIRFHDMDHFAQSILTTLVPALRF